MITATGSLPAGGCWPTGYVLYTHVSGMSSNILDLKMVDYGTQYNVDIMVDRFVQMAKRASDV